MDVKPPVHVPEGDKRFADPTWSENPAFFAVRQGYLQRAALGHRGCHGQVRQTDSIGGTPWVI